MANVEDSATEEQANDEQVNEESVRLKKLHRGTTVPFYLVLVASLYAFWYYGDGMNTVLMAALAALIVMPSIVLVGKTGQVVTYHASEAAIVLLFIIQVEPILACVLIIWTQMIGDSISTTKRRETFLGDWMQRAKHYTSILASTVGCAAAVATYELGAYLVPPEFLPVFAFLAGAMFGFAGAIPLSCAVSWVSTGKMKFLIEELVLSIPFTLVTSSLAVIVGVLAIYAPLYTILFVVVVSVPSPFVLKHVNTLQNEHYQLHNLLQISSGKKTDATDILEEVATTIGTMMGYRDAEIRNKPPEHGKEIGARLEDSSWLVISNPKYKFHLVEQDTKQLEGYASLILPVVESAKRRATMLQEIQTDELTKVANRKGLADTMGALPPGTPIAVLFFDLDKFKPVNDTYGHQAGDVALKTIASRMNEQRRGSDVVARVGGDEFVVVLANVEDESVAYSVAERIEERIHEPITIDAGVDVSIGTSYGVVLGRAEDFETLQDESDKLMYTKKRSRHNETKV